jgi:hypothetical protein
MDRYEVTDHSQRCAALSASAGASLLLRKATAVQGA